MTEDPQQREQMLESALEQLQAALDLLDRALAPAQIGAHVDLAVCQLRSLTGKGQIMRVEQDAARG